MFKYWIDFALVTMAILCLITIAGDIIVLFRKKVYKTWSTTSIIISCCVLLLLRIFAFIFLVLAQDKQVNVVTLIFLKTVLYESSVYFTINISLAMLRQWWRISSLLKNGIDSAKDEIVSNK